MGFLEKLLGALYRGIKWLAGWVGFYVGFTITGPWAILTAVVGAGLLSSWLGTQAWSGADILASAVAGFGMGALFSGIAIKGGLRFPKARPARVLGGWVALIAFVSPSAAASLLLFR